MGIGVVATSESAPVLPFFMLFVLWASGSGVPLNITTRGVWTSGAMGMKDLFRASIDFQEGYRRIALLRCLAKRSKICPELLPVRDEGRASLRWREPHPRQSSLLAPHTVV